MYGAIANGGKVVRPRVVSRVEDADGRILQRVDPEIGAEFRLKPSTISFLQEALKGVVKDPTGTGRAARLPGIEVSGKTGTAQVVRMPQDENKAKDESMVPYRFRDHAWFISYAPTESPEIVVAVLVEHGGHGGSAAAPLARQVMEEYFKNKPPVREARSTASSGQLAASSRQ